MVSLKLIVPALVADPSLPNCIDAKGEELKEKLEVSLELLLVVHADADGLT
jgi:hypothetical protein